MNKRQSEDSNRAHISRWHVTFSVCRKLSMEIILGSENKCVHKQCDQFPIPIYIYIFNFIFFVRGSRKQWSSIIEPTNDFSASSYFPSPFLLLYYHHHHHHQCLVNFNSDVVRGWFNEMAIFMFCWIENTLICSSSSIRVEERTVKLNGIREILLCV